VTDEADEARGDDLEKAKGGWGFPRFARNFPRHPELDALVLAFTRGDYRTVRLRAPELARTAEEEDVRRAALLLRERTSADPFSKVLVALTAVLLAVLAAWWITHDGPDGGHPTSTERPR
jgi:hypothetical protein